MTTLEAVDTASPGRSPLGSRPVHRAIPLRRIVTTELRKMFDTRAGFWLMASIGIMAALATSAVVLFAPNQEFNYSSFAAAIGIPTTIVLPLIAILSVTDEWSQRSGLTTFTLVPARGRVLMGKAIACLTTAAVSVPIAFGVGALGNLLGTAIAGVDPVWDLTVPNLLTIGLAHVLALLFGFMLGVLIRKSPGAMVAYFVYTFVLPPLTMLLAGSRDWFRKLQPWVDYGYAQSQLYDGALTAQQWTHLAVTAVIWLVVPLAVGLVLVSRTEVR